MEQRFGHDFSRVRIHTSEHASASAHAVIALAYTVGRDVVFERGQYEPETDTGRRLLAHELTHVVQQREAPVLPASPVQAGEQVKVHEQTDGQQVQREDQPAQQEKSSWEDIVDFSESVIWTLVKEFAPELEPILREILDKGILEWLKGKISSGIDTFIDTLMEPVRTVQGVAQWLSTHFSELLTWMQEAAAKLAKGDCSAITEASEKIQQVVSSIVTPIVDRVKEVAAKVGNVFTGLWDSFGAPIWDWLKKVGGAVWERIQQLGSWIWEKTEPIRNKITKAWTWIKQKLGIGEGPEGQNGLLQWVQNKAAEAWEWIKQKIEPIKKPLMIVAGVVGGIVVMLSPAGPFIAAGAAIGGLIAGIRWIRQHLNTPGGVVSYRDILQKVIIPGIINAIHSFTGKLASIAGLITDKLNGVMAGLGQVISAVGGSIISFAVKAVQWIADQFQSLVNWASDKLMALVDWVSRGLKRLLDFLQPVFNVLKQIGEVIFDILKLPGLILGKLWHMIPACIRDPFVNFLIEHILKKIPLLNKILAIPNIWEKIKARAMEIIHKIFKDGDLPGAIILVFKLILDVLKVPVELVTGIFAKAANALDLIMNDPIGFLKNVAGALKLGFVNFFKNIATHLLAGIAGWLFGELLDKGIHRPKDFSLMSIFTFVLEVLGLSLEKIFEKLEKKMPKQVQMIRKAVDTLAKVWDWFSTLLKEGPEGVWKKLQSKLGDLWGMFLDTVIGWVSKNIIGAMLEQLVSFLDPTGIMEIVQGIIDLYRLINSAVKYLEKILRIVNTILDTLVGIASGNLGPAAKMLEDALDLGVPVVIGFFAGLVSLDDIGDYLKDMVETIREKVDEAIEWLIDQAISVGQAVLNALGLGGEKEVQPAQAATEGDIDESVNVGEEAHTLRAHVEDGSTIILMASGTFGEIDQQIEQLRKNYEKNEQFKDLKPALDGRLDEIKAAKDEIESSATRAEHSGAGQPGEKAEIEATKIRRDGLIKLKGMLEKLGQDFKFGKGANVKQGDRITLLKGEPRGMLVAVTGIMVGGHFGIKVQSPADAKDAISTIVFYQDYEVSWRVDQKPAYIPFAIKGDTRVVTIDRDHLGTEGGEANVDPPGYSPAGPWDRRGHLVANMFGGPGNVSNIVALTHGANSGADAMYGIEIKVRDDIKNRDAVYEYKARPIYASTKQVPPVAVEVVADSLYPLPPRLEARSALNISPENAPKKKETTQETD